MAEPPIAWEPGIEIEGIPHNLTASLDETVTVGFRVDELGDYVVSFVTGIKGDERTLPEVEAFIRRISRMIDREPVDE